MEQMTLWNIGQTTKSVPNPIWEQLDPAVKMDVITKFSRLMAKTVSTKETQNKRENNHDQ